MRGRTTFIVMPFTSAQASPACVSKSSANFCAASSEIGSIGAVFLTTEKMCLPASAILGVLLAVEEIQEVDVFSVPSSEERTDVSGFECEASLTHGLDVGSGECVCHFSVDVDLQ